MLAKVKAVQWIDTVVRPRLSALQLREVCLDRESVAGRRQPLKMRVREIDQVRPTVDKAQTEPHSPGAQHVAVPRSRSAQSPPACGSLVGWLSPNWVRLALAWQLAHIPARQLAYFDKLGVWRGEMSRRGRNYCNPTALRACELREHSLREVVEAGGAVGVWPHAVRVLIKAALDSYAVVPKLRHATADKDHVRIEILLKGPPHQPPLRVGNLRMQHLNPEPIGIA
eukprot:2490376-Prymnesium_polylepis.2